MELESRSEDALRRKLKYFFMNPCEKFEARGRKPWKLLLQILKIGVVTAQLIFFGLSNQMMVTFEAENLLTFRHLFLKGYIDRNVDHYAVYTKSEVYEHIHFIIEQYVNLGNLSIGNHAYKRSAGQCRPLSVCWESYRYGSFFPENETFHVDPHIDTECVEVYPERQFGDTETAKHQLNFTLDFERLISVNIHLALRAINLQTVRHNQLPDCYDFVIVATFSNRAHSGRIKMTLNTKIDIKECRQCNITAPFARNNHYLNYDSVVILVCSASFILCARSMINAIQLQFEYAAFRRRHRRRASWSDRVEFVNGWHILILITDGLVIAGSALKISIQTKNFTNYDVCGTLLGTATMFVWVGVIRYLGFFQKYNFLILAVRAAFPNVVRFCCCVTMIYLGYCFCGWIVLGPYHSKFRTLNTAAECLFSVINGDIFRTFRNIRRSSYLVWIFSRIYLYSFVLLFAYMVLSLFITLITDTYESVKQSQRDGLMESDLHTFISNSKPQCS